MAKDREKRGVPIWFGIHWKRTVPLLALAVVVVLLCLVGGLAAKYVVVDNKDDNQISANDFYFSIDLLSATDQYAGQDENKITERTIHLYGATQTSLSFKVRNYFDDLRINPADITYTISYTADSGVPAVLESGNSQVTSGASYTLTHGIQDFDEFVVSAPNNTVEGGEIEVTVASSVPYVKTMTMTIVLHPQKYDVLYRVEDSVDSPYATLIIMAGKQDGVAAGKIKVDWSAINTTANVLQVDSTNTFVNKSGELTGVGVDNGEHLESFVSKEAIGELGSVAVYFFKADPSKNYSMPDTVAEAEGDVYQVILNAPAAN